MGRPRTPGLLVGSVRVLEAVFWRRVERSDLCWLWTGRARRYGYLTGSKNGRSRSVSVHRVSWVIHHGPIPDGLSVLHRCDVPRCVNPAHLFLGTQADNLRDMYRKGRERLPELPRLAGEAAPWAKVTAADVRQIRRDKIAGVRAETLAALHGLSRAQIYRIASGESWRG